MGGLRWFFLLLIALLVAGVAAVVVVRVLGGEEVGPPVALCPGPDEYGYICDSGPAVDYVDATEDSELYQDDNQVTLALPFTFTFYGTQFNEVKASSNGNLQFTTDNIWFENDCLSPGPAAGMGDMIAPYWDDLDLTFEGFLQTEVVGVAPERIFVVEWDEVPRFGSVDDRLTFEVQLFEGSNDIVFVYEDATTFEGPSGSSATIGLQSEAQGYALQLSCNQQAVNDGSAVRFVHPGQPEVAAGLSYVTTLPESKRHLPAAQKSRGMLLVETLNSRGRDALAALRAAWLSQRPAVDSEWLWADLDGDGEQEIVVLWWADASRPELVELAVAGRAGDQKWQLLWHEWPLARQDRYRSLRLAGAGDATGDGAEDILLRDTAGGRLMALTSALGGAQLLPLPGRCSGSMVLRDDDGDGVMAIIRDGCSGSGRLSLFWDGAGFQIAAGD